MDETRQHDRAVGPTEARRDQRAAWRRAGWYPPLTLGSAFEAAATRFPDAELIFASRSTAEAVTRGALHDRARRVANGLLDIGVATGERVLFQAPASAQSTVALEALWLIGAIVVPVVASAGDAEFAEIAKRSGAVTIVTAGRWKDLDLVARADRHGFERVVVVDSPAFGRGLPIEQLEAGEPLTSLPPIKPSSIACVIHTSGSTSAPKGVLHSHETLLCGYSKAAGAVPGVSLMAFPTGHIASALGLIRPLTTGGTTVVMDRWSPSRAAELIETHRVTSSAGTPFYLRAHLVRSPLPRGRRRCSPNHLCPTRCSTGAWRGEVDPLRDGVLAFVGGNVTEPFVDAEDVADVAVAALTDDRLLGRVHEVTGPRLMSFADAIAEIGAATGRDIAFAPISGEELAQGLAADGLTDSEVRAYVELFTTVLDGRNSHVTEGVRLAVGREPREFSDFVHATAASGVWDSPMPSVVGGSR